MQINKLDFPGIEANPFWVVKNSIEVYLSFLKNIFPIFTIEIMQCYENISLHGEFDLVNVLLKILDLVSMEKHQHGLEKISLLHKKPYYLLVWLLSHTLIHVENIFFFQKQGIRMGFLCSLVLQFTLCMDWIQVYL